MNVRPRRVLVKDSLDAERTRGVRRAKTALGHNVRCQVCGWRLPLQDASLSTARVRGLHGHHIVPVAEGGSKDETNVIVVCPNHHTVAHAIGAYVYANWKGEDPAKTHARMVRWLQLADERPRVLCKEIARLYRGVSFSTPNDPIAITHHRSHHAAGEQNASRQLSDGRT